LQLATLASTFEDEDPDADEDELPVSSVVVLELALHVVLSPSSICHHTQPIIGE
jgi:hypothetical protein